MHQSFFENLLLAMLLNQLLCYHFHKNLQVVSTVIQIKSINKLISYLFNIQYINILTT